MDARAPRWRVEPCDREAGRGSRLRSAVVRAFLVAIAVAVLAWPGAPALAGRVDEKQLAETYRRWLDDARLLLSRQERRDFLALEEDYQRDAFIAGFWRARDPYPETAENEFQVAWYSRLEYVRTHYGNDREDRARILLVQGHAETVLADHCGGALWPHEVWHYTESAQRRRSRTLIFYQDRGVGSYYLWNPNDGLLSLFGETKSWLEQHCQESGAPVPRTVPPVGTPTGRGLGDGDLHLACALRIVDRFCPADHAALLRNAILQITTEYSGFSFEALRAELERPPAPKDDEWLASFAAYSTRLPPGAETFAAELAVRFGEGEGLRIAVEGEIAVPAAGVEVRTIEGRPSYDFDLIGEVFRGGDLHESFRYRFDVPAAGGEPDPLRLSFRRDLRPGDYRLVLRLEDLHSGRFWRHEADLAVPEGAAVAPAAGGVAGDGPAAAAEAGAPPDDGLTFRLLVPDEVVSGMVRIDAEVAGGPVERVTFFLDGEPLLTKTRPPYGVEVDLGPVPLPHTVSAVALDAAGKELATDAVRVNLGDYRFTVELVQPANGSWVGTQTSAQVEVHPPEGRSVERVEMFVGEERVATLYQPPYTYPLSLPEGPTYVRAVAHLADGGSHEDLSLVNAGAFGETVDVRLVELYVSALDASGRAVDGLVAADFTVRENGVEQELLRCEQVRERPIHLAILIDSSASMEPRLPAVREAAARFLAQIVTAKDRAAVVAFSDRLGRPLRFTADREALAAQLAALKAERGTALYDNLVSTLVHFNGVPGQRAVLLLSDGKDRLSRYRFDETRDLVRASGVAVYPIGVDLPRREIKARRELDQLAAASGGRSFFVEDVGELDAVYAAIEAELRAKYLLVYQAPGGAGGAFRAVEVRVNRPGVEVRAPAGYFP